MHVHLRGWLTSSTVRLQTDQRGCATFTFALSTFTKLDNKMVQDQLILTAAVEEEGTGLRSRHRIEAV